MKVIAIGIAAVAAIAVGAACGDGDSGPDEVGAVATTNPAGLTTTTRAAAGLPSPQDGTTPRSTIGCVPDDMNASQCFGADLAGQDLREMILAGFVLVDANLAGANLTDALLGDANLAGANLTEAVLVGADLDGADLSGADLSGADLSDADFGEATLEGARLAGADLSRASLRDADLTGADLTDAILREAALYNTNLSGADLSGADLTAAYGYAMNWEGATLDGATLDGAHFDRALNLTDTMLASVMGVVLDQLPAALSAHAVVLESDMSPAWAEVCAGRPIADAVAGWSVPAQILYPDGDKWQGGVEPARWPAAARFADVVACFDLQSQSYEKVTSCGVYSVPGGGYSTEVFLSVGTLEIRLVDAATATDLSTFTITSVLPDGCPRQVSAAIVGGVGLGAGQTSPTPEITARVDALVPPS